jgi:hypothetical protein
VNGFLTEESAHCPFCGEPISLLVDTSADSQNYIEDCQVCCRPMEVDIEAVNGELVSLDVRCAS